VGSKRFIKKMTFCSKNRTKSAQRRVPPPIFVRFFAQNATEKPEYQIFLMQFHTKFPSPRWTARIDRIA